MNHAFVIAFRDRGIDPLRKANLEHVLAYVHSLNLGSVYIVDDGRADAAQFNRHAAYNSGATQAFAAGADIITFYEADMILPRQQLTAAIEAATERPGLVVPFTERHELNTVDSGHIRAGADHTAVQAEVVMPKPRRTGAINVISRDTYNLVGQYDPAFEGSHWDDKAMHLAFDKTAGPTRWIDGPAWHLYHLPGHQGRHLTSADRAATERNKRRYHLYRTATTAQRIRELTSSR